MDEKLKQEIILILRQFIGTHGEGCKTPDECAAVKDGRAMVERLTSL